jgi:two-component system sensor histidine kinase HydH
VTSLALLVGVAAIGVSTGPGLRALRWFGVAALCASVYGMCALESTLSVPPEWRGIFGRVGSASAGMLTASWFVYFAATQKRPLAKWERWLIAGIALDSFLWLIPGLMRSNEVFVRVVTWLGTSYTTTRPTPLGQVTYVFLMIAVLVLDARMFLAWRRAEPSAFVNFLSVTVQFIAGMNDALAASGKTDMPYLLDLGQFVVVLAVGTTLIARFIADARALERSSSELRAAQTELVRRERLAALGELSAVVAHEVRNPVTVIFNAVSTLRKEPVSPAASTLLNIVNEEAERLKRVVGELLEFARPRALMVDSVAPGKLVEGAVEAARAALDGADGVNVELAPDLPDIDADEQLLRQALINLITNALQAVGRKGPVEVRVTSDGEKGMVAFAVADDGAGINKDVAEKMFTPFFTTRASGTGLGLAIVKRIAEAHTGEVAWEPADPGVTFMLRVPIHRNRPQ